MALMKIKQVVLVIILILSLIGFLMPSLFAAEIQVEASGANNVVAESAFSIRADNPGILQTNPFYFVKEWKRGIARAFTFNPVSKLQYDLQVTIDKAAELKRLEEIGLADDDNLRHALSNYGNSLKALEVRLQSADVRGADTSRMNEFLSDLMSGVSKQVQFLEQLESQHPELGSDIESNQVYLDRILEAAIAKFKS